MYFIIKTLSTYGIDTGITWKERSMTQHHHPPIYLIFLYDFLKVHNMVSSTYALTSLDIIDDVTSVENHKKKKNS